MASSLTSFGGHLSIIELASGVKQASKTLALASSTQKNHALLLMAEMLIVGMDSILSANESDLKRAVASDLGDASIDRLILNEARLLAMADQIKEVVQLADPIGEITDGYLLPNGLRVRRERVPLGVVGIIYENRPNVTSDSAALCIKSGNAAFLRGSSAAISSNLAIADLIASALEKSGLPRQAVTIMRETSRESAVDFMNLSGYIDCLIPRGGRSLLDTVRANAKVPVIIDGDGNCHIFVDATADVASAKRIIANSKMQRPGVCNAVETVLLHEKIAPQILEDITSFLPNVEIRGDDFVCSLVPTAKRASEQDFATEFLDLILAVKVVTDMDEAISHIATYGSGHSEAILTSDFVNANRFTREVDAAAVLVNTSTRFVDGNQLGLGAEIGISTQKLHARGPMGLKALTCERYVIEGDGQIRP